MNVRMSLVLIMVHASMASIAISVSVRMVMRVSVNLAVHSIFKHDRYLALHNGGF